MASAPIVAKFSKLDKKWKDILVKKQWGTDQVSVKVETSNQPLLTVEAKYDTVKDSVAASVEVENLVSEYKTNIVTKVTTANVVKVKAEVNQVKDLQVTPWVSFVAGNNADANALKPANNHVGVDYQYVYGTADISACTTGSVSVWNSTQLKADVSAQHKSGAIVGVAGSIQLKDEDKNIPEKKSFEAKFGYTSKDAGVVITSKQKAETLSAGAFYVLDANTTAVASYSWDRVTGTKDEDDKDVSGNAAFAFGVQTKLDANTTVKGKVALAKPVGADKQSKNIGLVWKQKVNNELTYSICTDIDATAFQKDSGVDANNAVKLGLFAEWAF